MLKYITHEANLSGHRIEFLNGEEHIVIPTVAAVQGVLNGQLLTMEAIGASLPAWEGVAVTMSHPKLYGNDISANTQHAVENFVVGRFFNVHIDNEKFKGEFWVNMALLQKHEDGDTFLGMLEAGETIEVSTAYWCKNDGKGGIFKGQSFSATQTDLIPNHVAILLHEQGACSVRDGCGTPRTNAEATVEAPCERKTNAIQKLIEKFGKATMDTLAGLTGNEMSHGKLREDLHMAIAQNERSDAWTFIVDVFDSRVVYGVELPNGEVNLFQRNYLMNEDGLIIENAQEVERVVSYEPVSNSEEEDHMQDRDELIEKLATNENVPFDRDTLAGMTDDQISHLATNLGDTQDPDPVVETVTEEPVQESTPAIAEPVVANSLSPEVVEALNGLGANGIAQVVNASKELAAQRKQQKDELVSRLTANAAVTIDEATLRRMDLEALQGVASMAGVRGVDFAGLGGPVANRSKSSGPPAPPSVVLDHN